MVLTLKEALQKATKDMSLTLYIDHENSQIKINGEKIILPYKGMLILVTNYVDLKTLELEEEAIKNTACLLLPNKIANMDHEISLVAQNVLKYLEHGYLYLQAPSPKSLSSSKFEILFVKTLLKKLEYIQKEESNTKQLLDNVKYITLLRSISYETYDLLSYNFADKEISMPPELATFSKFITLLETHTNREYGIDFFATNLGLSRTKLQLLSKKIYGITPKEMIQTAILNKAKGQLIYTNKSIKEISYDLGFSEPTNFNKFFLRLEQKTPRNFRQAYLKKDPTKKDHF